MRGSDLAGLIRECYGVDVAELRQLPSEVDRVELVIAADGTRFVVKVTSGAGLEPRIRWQHEVLRAAAGADGVRVQRIIPTLDGEDVLTLADGSLLRLYTWLAGSPVAELRTHSPSLLREWGRAAAVLTNALSEVEVPPGLDLSHHWEVLRARESVDAVIGAIGDKSRRQKVEVLMARFDDAAATGFEELPKGVVHQDLNDFNVLALTNADGRRCISGVVDFGDALPTAAVADLAVAVAYAMTRKPDPLVAAMNVVAGYAQERPLTGPELEVVYPLAAARLCVNAATWSSRSDVDQWRYATARMHHSWPAIEKLIEVPPALATAALAGAAGVEQVAARGHLRRWLGSRLDTFAPVVDDMVEDVDLSAESAIFDRDQLDGDAFATIATLATDRAVAGRHLTSRFMRLRPRRTRGGELPSIHLGVDVWARCGQPILAPYDGVVARVGEPDEGLVISHRTDSDLFWSRWSGIDSALTLGARVHRGDELGRLVGRGEHRTGSVNVQLFDDWEVAQVASDTVPVSLAGAWGAVSPDPSAFVGIRRQVDEHWGQAQVLGTRQRRFAGSQKTYYEDPMEIVRAGGVTLVDREGRTYLDAINNVSHVGHANAAVVSAIERQTRRLNTNSRFVYESLSRYADRLVGLLPEPLEVVFFVCTGSEANDLALRISRSVTGRRDVIVIDGAYHGSTAAATEISPNRYKGTGSSGIPPHTHEVLTPDRYRGPFGYDDPDAGVRYAAELERVAAKLLTNGTPPAAFIAESLMGTAGTIVHPDGYLQAAYDHARRAGAVCIADEVQVGFGRVGTSFWAFEDQGVVPDIVTLGKPIGNGHPLAAVVTTRELADAFDTGMKYFNTFGGNPVSCEVGLAVLDEIEGRGLQQRAFEVGSHFSERLRELQVRNRSIGDVRGRGLYLGIDLVSDPEAKTPDAALAERVSEQMRDEGIIVIPTGTAGNVLKVKPPMIFTREDADQFADTLSTILSDPW